jgi:hypothetical protein
MSGIMIGQERLREQGSATSYQLVHSRPLRPNATGAGYMELHRDSGIILLFPVREFIDRIRTLEREEVWIKRDARVSCDQCNREFGSRHKVWLEDSSIICPTCAERLGASNSLAEESASERDAWSKVIAAGTPQIDLFSL